MRGAVTIPTGPGDREIERLIDLLDSLRAWVPDETIVVVDDAPEPRSVSAHGADVVVRPPRPRKNRHRYDRMTVGSLSMLRWFVESELDYIIKIDTDALIIGDYRSEVHAAMSQHPEVGVWGAYAVPKGQQNWSRRLQRATWPVRPGPRRGGVLPEQAVYGHKRRARKFLINAIRDARRHRYQLGQHCQGGAYVVTRSGGERMRLAGYLDDPLATASRWISEDVIVSLLAVASGSQLGELAAPGEAFAIQHRGLLAAPADLEARGHAVIHCIKNDDRFSETEIREFFAARRPRRSNAAPSVSTRRRVN